MVEVGVFEPDLDETVENSTRDQRAVMNGSVRLADIEGRCIGGTDKLLHQSIPGIPRHATHAAAGAVNVDAIDAAEADLASTPRTRTVAIDMPKVANTHTK